MAADRILELRRVPARELIPNPKNWRRHPEAQRRALRAMLDDIGYADVLLARETPAGLELIDGHLRAEATPDAEVPVLVLDLDDEEAAKLLASLDPLGAMAETDSAALAALLEAVALPEDLLAALGAQAGRNGGTQGHTEPDAAPPLPKRPRTRAGDLWVLGEHRLLCGDATSAENLSVLLDGSPIHLIYTDPPYGVQYEGGTKRRAPLAGDTETESGPLYEAVFSAADGLLGCGVMIWFASKRPLALFTAAARHGWEPRAVIIWVKESAHYGRLGAHYKTKAETLLYCVGSKAPKWRGPTNENTVWEFPQPRVNDLHPTQKPVALGERAIANHTDPGDGILDLFVGSGSAIIAAEQTGRRCFAMEIDPGYVDVAVTRWEQFTDQKAERTRA